MVTLCVWSKKYLPDDLFNPNDSSQVTTPTPPASPERERWRAGLPSPFDSAELVAGKGEGLARLPLRGTSGQGGDEKSDFLYYQDNFLGKDLLRSNIVANQLWLRGTRCYP